jgi:hypothetical protein
MWLGVESKKRRKKDKEGRTIHRKESGFFKAWVEAWLE